MSSTYNYSAEDPINLSENKDLSAHISASNNPPLPFYPANPFPAIGGSTFVIMDHAPNLEGKPSLMYRTQTLDYTVVLYCEVELLLDSWKKRVCKVGDCVVQRAMMHAWKSLSVAEGARIAFVILSSEKVIVQGKELANEM